MQPVRGEQDSVGSNKRERVAADQGVMLGSEMHFSRPHFKHRGMISFPLMRAVIFAKVRLQHLEENGGSAAIDGDALL